MAQESLRRLRLNPFVRDLVRSYDVQFHKLIQPVFVVEGLREREAVLGLTGTYRDTSDSLLKTIERDLEVGVNKFLLFTVPQERSLDPHDFEFAETQIQSIRKRFGRDLFLAADVCLCSYASHGHCGVLSAEQDHVENGATVRRLAQAALAYAQAGADCVAPSDMMDGRVGAIRESLDQAALYRTLIMSYSAKFHSRFYGPFRNAADSAPKGNLRLMDRATYQIDPGNPMDAHVSSIRDAEEGADILMVKPGLPYLDVLYQLSQEIRKPWAVYEVSGEFAAIELLAEKGLMNAAAGHLESWTALFRAGAEMVITYGARFAQDYLRKV